MFLCLTSGLDAAKSSEIFRKIDGILQRDVFWDNYTSFGVDDTNSNIGDVMKLVKPSVMQLYRDSSIHMQTQNQVEDCKLHTGLAT